MQTTHFNGCFAQAICSMLFMYGLHSHLQLYIVTPGMRTPWYSVKRTDFRFSIWTVQNSLDNADFRLPPTRGCPPLHAQMGETRLFLFLLLFGPGNKPSKTLSAELIRSEHCPDLRVWVVVYEAIPTHNRCGVSRTDKR